MKSITRKIQIYLKVFIYFFDGLFRYLTDPIGRLFSPNDTPVPAIGVQPYEGEYYAKWESLR